MGQMTTKSPYHDLDSGLRPVSQNHEHYLSGRWFLLAEGLLLIALSIGGLVSAATQPGDGDPRGAPVLIFWLTPMHSAVLLTFGVLAAAATLHRRSTIIVGSIGALGFLLLFALGAPAATAPGGPMGFDLHDVGLHAVLLGYNIGLMVWLIPDALEDESWVPDRPDAPGQPRTPRHHPSPASAGR